MAASRSFLVLAALLALPAPAAAQSVGAADALYREGKKLMKEGKIAEGCRKLEESYKLDKTGGTLINLAECHAQEGKIATAYGEFQSALELAQQLPAGPKRTERIKYAEKQIKDLEPKVPYVTITLEGERPAGLVVRLDKTELGAGVLGSSLPVDPGKHVLALTAPKYEPYEEVIDVARLGEKRGIVVPALKPAKEPEPEKRPERRPDRPSGGWMWPTGFTLLGVGVVGLGVGTGLGVLALDKGKTTSQLCTNGLCSQQGFDAWQSGRAAAAGADAAFVVGGVCAAAGVVLLAVAPPAAAPWAGPPKASGPRLLAVSPWAGPAGAGVSSLFAW